MGDVRAWRLLSPGAWPAIKSENSRSACRVRAPITIVSSRSSIKDRPGIRMRVDNERRPRHPEIQQWHKRLPSGHDFAVAACRHKRLNRGFEIAGSNIIEWGGLHSISRERSRDFTSAVRQRVTFNVHGTQEFFFQRRRVCLPGSRRYRQPDRSGAGAAATSSAPSPRDSPLSMNFAPEIDSGALRASTSAKADAPDNASIADLIHKDRSTGNARAS